MQMRGLSAKHRAGIRAVSVPYRDRRTLQLANCIQNCFPNVTIFQSPRGIDARCNSYSLNGTPLEQVTGF